MNRYGYKTQNSFFAASFRINVSRSGRNPKKIMHGTAKGCPGSHRSDLGDKPGLYANKLIDACGIVSDLNVFYSFLHTFKDMLKEECVKDRFRDKLCGHENK